jgi:hypothetical protein
MVDTFHSLLYRFGSSVSIDRKTSDKANHPRGRWLKRKDVLYVNLDGIVICPDLGLILVFEFFGSKLAPNRHLTLSPPLCVPQWLPKARTRS